MSWAWVRVWAALTCTGERGATTKQPLPREGGGSTILHPAAIERARWVHLQFHPRLKERGCTHSHCLYSSCWVWRAFLSPRSQTPRKRLSLPVYPLHIQPPRHPTSASHHSLVPLYPLLLLLHPSLLAPFSFLTHLSLLARSCLPSLHLQNFPLPPCPAPPR